MIDTQALRKKILDAAIRGKLTMQLPEDGNADDLYKEIQVEKQRLIKEGKIKKEKPLPEITKDDIPFDIPENWKWARWGNLSFSIQYGFNAPALQKGRIRMVRISDIQNNAVAWNTVPYCNIEEKDIPDYLLEANDILFARTGGTVGKSYLVKEVPCESIYAGYLIRTRYSSNLVPSYMKYFMESQLYWDQLKEGTTATAQPNCNGQTLSKMLIPLPPLAEQKRIADKIDSAFSKLDLVDEEQKKLADNSQALRNKLIEFGIRGKLTEQLASDCNAETLYADIQKEKQRLIKEGKIKKEKPLPEIAENDIPFDIPENWKWVRLADVVEIRNGFTPSKTNPLFWKSKDIPWFTVFDKNKQGSFISSTEQYISNSAIGTSSDRIVPKDSVLLCCTASIGEYAYTLIDLTTNQQWNGLTPKDIKLLYSKYLFYWVQTKKKDMLDSAGTTTFPFLSTKKLGMFVFPLPPLAEQKRIVEKLDQLLPLCDAMSAEIAGGESA